MSIVSKRLKYEIMIFATLGLLASVVTYSLSNLAGDWLINKQIEPIFVSANMNAQLHTYQQFVTDKKIDSKEWNKLQNWSSEDKRLFLLSVSGDKSEGSLSSKEAKTTVSKTLGVQVSVDILYNNGKVMTHFVYIRPRDMLHQTKTVLALLLSFATFLGVVYFFLNKKLNYIAVIEHGISILESGDMQYKIKVRGEDELSRLAMSLNTMSRTFMEKDLSEKMAIQTSKDIIGELSHDIRTPLTIISGYVPILVDDPSMNPQQKEYLNLIRGKTEQMNRRINDLLDYSVIYSGQQEIKKSLVSVKEIIAQLVLEMKPFPLVVKDETSQHSRISVDEMLISRVFDNLLSNMYKYADLEQEILLACFEENDRLVIQLQNVVRTDTRVEGKSLGLKISRYIVERHGGNLEVENLNGWFSVSLVLPLSLD